MGKMSYNPDHCEGVRSPKQFMGTHIGTMKTGGADSSITSMSEAGKSVGVDPHGKK